VRACDEEPRGFSYRMRDKVRLMCVILSCVRATVTPPHCFQPVP
jgi:hypothetical protein